jgi:cbb3-type cytochrome oxidase maturation protein
VAPGVVGRSGHGAELSAGRAQCLTALKWRQFTWRNLMDILYLLVPLSVILVFFILGGLWWAIYRGQFEDIESEGERILKDS